MRLNLTASGGEIFVVSWFEMLNLNVSQDVPISLTNIYNDLNLVARDYSNVKINGLAGNFIVNASGQSTINIKHLDSYLLELLIPSTKNTYDNLDKIKICKPGHVQMFDCELSDRAQIIGDNCLASSLRLTAINNAQFKITGSFKEIDVIAKDQADIAIQELKRDTRGCSNIVACQNSSVKIDADCYTADINAQNTAKITLGAVTMELRQKKSEGAIINIKSAPKVLPPKHVSPNDFGIIL